LGAASDVRPRRLYRVDANAGGILARMQQMVRCHSPGRCGGLLEWWRPCWRRPGRGLRRSFPSSPHNQSAPASPDPGSGPAGIGAGSSCGDGL